MINHHGDNGIAAISACRFPKRPFGDGSIILPSKGPNPEVRLEFAQMSPACIIFEIAIAYANLVCNETKHVSSGGFSSTPITRPGKRR